MHPNGNLESFSLQTYCVLHKTKKKGGVKDNNPQCDI